MMQRSKEKDRRHLSFSFGFCIICPFALAFASSVLFFWPLHHLSFSFGLCIIRSFSYQRKRTDERKVKGKGQMMQRSKEKDRRYKGQKKRTDDTQVKGKGHMIQRSNVLFV
jgi:hypothetical protein